MKSNVKETAKYPLTGQIQEILAVIVGFSNLLAKETAALKKADFKAVDALQAEKRVFARQYQAQVMALSARKNELTQLELPLRERLIRERTRFNDILAENMHALELAQNSTKRLVNRILEAAREAVISNNPTNYSSAGKATTYKSASTSISIDRSL